MTETCTQDHGRYNCECAHLDRCPTCHGILTASGNCDCNYLRGDHNRGDLLTRIRF